MLHRYRVLELLQELVLRNAILTWNNLLKGLVLALFGRRQRRVFTIYLGNVGFLTTYEHSWQVLGGVRRYCKFNIGSLFLFARGMVRNASRLIILIHIEVLV